MWFLGLQIWLQFLATAIVTHKVYLLPKSGWAHTEQQLLHLTGNSTPPPELQNVSHFLERLEGDLQ